MRDKLKEKYESLYREREDPWDYWTSEYELRKYGQQISLVAQFGTPRRILEIGCSTGAHTKLIHNAFPEANITAIDISSTAIARASQNVDFPGVVNFYAADIFSFAEKLQTKSLDVIFFSEVFEFLHEHCTIAEFSCLIRHLNACLSPCGILCISNIVPNPLFYSRTEACQKNIRVFYELIGDYFREIVSTNSTLRKVEVERTYRYGIRLYRPRALEFPGAEPDESSIDKVDIVIPARDEVETVADVITRIKRAPKVRNIIVVDNGSVDGTGEAASAAGASVVHCSERGYGRAVKCGVQQSECRWVLKLDADIENVEADWVELLINCATREKVRLAKTYWTASLEDPDWVTNFSVKPAFRIFFPELLFVHSPLSGIYLFDKHIFDLHQLPNDFSFDVGLLIGALNGAHPIGQVEVNRIRHATIAKRKRTYQHYFNMSEELLRYIIQAGIDRFQ
jgi:SAM-dependent methyltransferase